jgi:hypothetical protein
MSDGSNEITAEDGAFYPIVEGRLRSPRYIIVSEVVAHAFQLETD